MTSRPSRGPSRWAVALLLVVAVALVGAACEGAPGPTEPTAAATSGTGIPTEGDAAPAPSELPSLAAAPAGDMALWAATIGLPVVAAVRTATPLAQLADTPPASRPAVCRQVALELDTIAAPQRLSAVAITADAESATLLVGDLRAKADLLAACDAGGPALDDLIAEVERTHAVAVAWLAVLREG